jgi:WD40 repeat protein
MMAAENQYDVFLSHSSRDKAVVRELAQRLKDDGLRVWFDEWIIKPGDMIGKKIDEGLASSRVLLLCMSKHFFASEWSSMESGSFRFRDPTNKEGRFIPLRLDKTEVPLALRQFAYVEWGRKPNDSVYERLLEAIRPLQTELPAPADQARSLDKITRVLSLGHTDAVRSVAFSPDCRRVVSGSSDYTVRLWDIASGRCEAALQGHTSSVYCVSWSGDGRRLVSASRDNTVRLWDIASGRCESTLQGHTAEVLSVSWSGDGRRVVSGSVDNTVRLWDIARGRCEATLQGHTAAVLSVSWSCDGRRVVSGSADKTVRLWDVTSGRCEAVLQGHSDEVNSVSWSDDGRRVVSGSDDHTVRLWDIARGRCEALLGVCPSIAF